MNKDEKLKIAAVIPARMASSRFPGKPLQPILGLAMVEHVRRRVQMCDFLSDVIVATCDIKIMETVTRFGGKTIMTSDKHEGCIDRVAEAAETLDADIIINVQGDMPFVRPEALNDLIKPFADRHVLVTDLMSPVKSEAEFQSPNVVKVIVNNKNDALYYSREPIPSLKKYSSGDCCSIARKQLGIMA